MQKLDQQLSARVLEKLIEHLRSRSDVQNIDLMNLAGFCRNCLSRWYKEAGAEKGIELTDDECKHLIYGMDYNEWKKQFQKPASPDVLAKMAEIDKNH